MLILLLLGAATAGFPPVPPAVPRTTNTVEYSSGGTFPRPAQPAPAPEPLPTHYGPSGEIVQIGNAGSSGEIVPVVNLTSLNITNPHPRGKAVGGPYSMAGMVYDGDRFWSSNTIRVQEYPDMRVLYPKPHRAGTNGLHLIFEHVDTTNACTLQMRSSTGDWQDVPTRKPWVPYGRVSLFVTNDTQYRLLVPTTPKRKQE